MTTVRIHGYAHGDDVYHPTLDIYGHVHTYGVVASSGIMAEVRWSTRLAATEALTEPLARVLVPVSGDLPRCTASRPGRPDVPESFPEGVHAPRVTPRKPRSRAPQTGTEHTCNGGRGPTWGRKTRGCPRCDELLAGHATRTWG